MQRLSGPSGLDPSSAMTLHEPDVRERVLGFAPLLQPAGPERFGLSARPYPLAIAALDSGPHAPRNSCRTCLSAISSTSKEIVVPLTFPARVCCQNWNSVRATAALAVGVHEKMRSALGSTTYSRCALGGRLRGENERQRRRFADDAEDLVRGAQVDHLPALLHRR